MIDGAANARSSPIGGTRGVAAVVLVVAAFCSFTRLGSASLWDDEAYVAITARNLLRFGKFTVWDGRNVYIGTMDRGYNLRVKAPPLDTVIAAASFRVCGQSNTTVRLPFAVVNLCTLAVFIFLLRRWFPNQRVLVNYATALLGMSTQFLLIGRNARYYALAVLFGLLTYATYRRVVRAPSILSAVGLGVSALLMFYAHPLSAAAMLVALFFLHVVFSVRKTGWKSYVALGGAGVLFLCGAIPIAMGQHLGDFALSQAPAGGLGPVARRLLLAWYEVRELSLMSALPWVLVIGVGVFLWATRRNKDWGPTRTNCIQMLWLSLVYAVAMGFLSPTAPKANSIGDIRYLFPLLPFATIAMACFFAWLHARSPRIAIGILLVTVTTNLFEWIPFQRDYPDANAVRLTLPGLVAEVLGPYPTATESVCTVLRENAKQDEVIETFPVYWSYPLIYYVGDRVRIGGLLRHATAPPPDLIRDVHAPLFMEDIYPDWVICYGAERNPMDYAAYFGRPHTEGGVEVRRQYRLATVLPLFPAQTQRPELPWHSFGPRAAEPDRGLGIYILRSGS